MSTLAEQIRITPVVPYIRECDYAVRGPWIYPNRRLLDYLLIYVAEGDCLFTVDDIVYRFAKGDFCLIQPNSTVALEGITHTITPFVHLDIFYHPKREDSFPTRAGQIDLSGYACLLQPRLNDLQDVHIPVPFKPKHPAWFRDTLIHMIQSWQTSGPLKELEAGSLAMQLVLALLEDHAAAEKQTLQPAQLLNWIASYMSMHLSEPIAVADMAKRANLSESRFRVVFKEKFGVSPYQYLLRFRFRHAQELLATTDYSLKQIAEYCGFSDIHHFSKAFKKETGQAPGTGRKSRD